MIRLPTSLPGRGPPRGEPPNGPRPPDSPPGGTSGGGSPGRRRWRAGGLAGLGAIFALAVWLVLGPLSEPPPPAALPAPEVLSHEGEVLGRRAGREGQAHYPRRLEEMSPWLARAAIAVEDRRFYRHDGCDRRAILRALRANLRRGQRVSGASTLAMQVCRMRQPGPRTWWAKWREARQAVRLTDRVGRRAILEEWLNQAPFGGNLRGVEAAAWRYFGRSCRHLAIEEAALLIGLPQAPERLRPDRHPEAALRRRRTVLLALATTGHLTPDQARELADRPLRLSPPPRLAESEGAVAAALRSRPQGGRTSLRASLQRDLFRLSRALAVRLPPHLTVAAVILDADTGDLHALCPNARPEDPATGQVDCALARRSTGSTLKPFLYALAVEQGRIGWETILLDAPREFAGWHPRNWDRQFHGALSAESALRHSLNLPALGLLAQTGLEPLAEVLRRAGLPLAASDLRRAGLTLVTGGLEASLLEVTSAYACLARQGRPVTWTLFPESRPPADERPVLSPAVCASLNQALDNFQGGAGAWGLCADSLSTRFAWKTGTSSANRDAWAVGHNGGYVVAVWIGALRGAGPAELTGPKLAAPLLVEILHLPQVRARARPEPFQSRDPDPARGPSTRPPAVPALPVAVARRPQAPRILSPSTGVHLVATREGFARLYPRADLSGPLLWFLDDHPLPSGAGPLLVSPGRHRLRCVTPDGAWAASPFTVLPP